MFKKELPYNNLWMRNNKTDLCSAPPPVSGLDRASNPRAPAFLPCTMPVTNPWEDAEKLLQGLLERFPSHN